MSWAAITETDVKTRISGAELEAIRSSHLADGQSDTVPAVITQITNRIRRACSDNGSIALGAAGTIPVDLLSEALDLIVRELMKRPGYIGDDALTKVRLEAAATADKTLLSISAGDVSISDADPSGNRDVPVEITETARSYDEDERLMT